MHGNDTGKFFAPTLSNFFIYLKVKGDRYGKKKQFCSLPPKRKECIFYVIWGVDNFLDPRKKIIHIYIICV